MSKKAKVNRDMIELWKTVSELVEKLSAISFQLLLCASAPLRAKYGHEDVINLHFCRQVFAES